MILNGLDVQYRRGHLFYVAFVLSQRQWRWAITTCRSLCCQYDAHRDISLRCEVRSLSGHSGHGRTYCWLDPVANDPRRTSGPLPELTSTPSSVLV